MYTETVGEMVSVEPAGTDVGVNARVGDLVPVLAVGLLVGFRVGLRVGEDVRVAHLLGVASQTHEATDVHVVFVFFVEHCAVVGAEHVASAAATSAASAASGITRVFIPLIVLSCVPLSRAA